MCLYPNSVQTITNKETGEIRRVFHEGIFNYYGNWEDDFNISTCVTVPCGSCVECLEQYSNVWAYRCMLEAKFHKENCMITLTYDEAHNPITLVRRDVQLFLKRLRKAHSDISIRYFGCAEYGGKNLRPHFHILIFGYRPKDLCYFKKEGDHTLYLSNEISDLWEKGFITVGDVSLYSAKYSAKYLQKLRPIPSCLRPQFTFMSTKPGIGLFGVGQKNYETDKIYLEGKAVSLPRYFVKKAPDIYQEFIHVGRRAKAELFSNSLYDRRVRILQKKKILGKVKK